MKKDFNWFDKTTQILVNVNGIDYISKTETERKTKLTMSQFGAFIRINKIKCDMKICGKAFYDIKKFKEILELVKQRRNNNNGNRI